MRTEVEVFAPFVFAGFAGCSVPPEFEDCRATCSTDVEPPNSDVDLPPVDAPPPPPPDEPMTPTGTLRVKIAHEGRVDVVGIGTCDSANDNRCDFIVDLGTPQTLIALPAHEFDKWGKACSGEVSICVVVPRAPMTEVDAKFEKD